MTDNIEYMKRYYKEHRDECLLRTKKYYEKNKEKIKDYSRTYRKKHYKSLSKDYREHPALYMTGW